MSKSIEVYLTNEEERRRAIEIATHHGLPISSFLREALRQANRKMPDFDARTHKALFAPYTNPATGRRSSLLPDAETLRAKMDEKGWTINRAAKHYKCSSMTVWRKLQQLKETSMKDPSIDQIVNPAAKVAIESLNEIIDGERAQWMQALIQSGNAIIDGENDGETLYAIAESFTVCPPVITNKMAELLERAIALGENDPIGTLGADAYLCIESYRNFIHNQMELLQAQPA